MGGELMDNREKIIGFIIEHYDAHKRMFIHSNAVARAIGVTKESVVEVLLELEKDGAIELVYIPKCQNCGEEPFDIFGYRLGEEVYCENCDSEYINTMSISRVVYKLVKELEQ
jgi:predicted Zn-ribbon and HTH transcriptional regulator